jgi:Holliday junction resolvasome RuvABC endonuclease subunit
MKICGLDLSMNGSGLVSFELDNNLDIISTDYLGFIQVKKHCSKKVIHYRKKDFDHRYYISDMMIKKIKEFVKDADYLAIEDYAFGAKGNTFDIGEFIGQVKMMLFKEGHQIRLYDPNSIKKFATGKGNSDKISMYLAFKKDTEIKPDLSSYPVPSKGSGASPTSDIVDAYYITRLLRVEVLLRKGLLNASQLTEEEISIFNRTTKSRPVNLLDTDFLKK